MALYKRKTSKYWWMKFTFDGQLRQRSTYVKNKRDAELVESAYRTELALGKVGIEPKKKAPLFKDAVEDFLKLAKVKHTAKQRTYDRYYFSCQPLKKYFGTKKSDQIKSKDVEGYILWRSRQISRRTGESISRETINYEMMILKKIFNRLVESRQLRENPAAKISRLPKNERTFHVLSVKEEAAYLLACPQPLQDIADLMLQTGMRPNELYELKRQHFYPEKKFLQVVNGKTESSNRKVWLTEKALLILNRRLDKFAGVQLFPANDCDGQPATRDLSPVHRKTIKSLKLKFRLYDCRHTFATRAVEAGTDLLTLASILGHSNLSEVMRYAHPSENLKNEAIQKMQKIK